MRPQLGQNIGAAARAMLNFGLTDLRLVAPRDGWPNPDAGPPAAGADIVLAGAQVFDTLAGAVADCVYSYATTVRPRGLTKPVVTPARAAAEIRARPARSALIFGPERSGLLTEDLTVAHAILTVPVNPDFGSLNLAQAVLLCAYAWHQASDATPPSRLDMYDGPASHAELEGLFGQLDGALRATNYYHTPDREAVARRTVRNLLTRPAYSGNEVRTWRGIIAALVNARPPRA